MGFRAPSYQSMITALCENVCQAIPENKLYSASDPEPSSPGSVSFSHRRKIQSAIKSEVNLLTTHKFLTSLTHSLTLYTPLTHSLIHS